MMQLKLTRTHRAALLAGLVMLVMMAAAPARADLVADTLKGFEICVERFPETRQTARVLEDAGFRGEGTDGNFRLYSLDGRRGIVATGTTQGADQGCMMAVSKMTADQATTLAARFLKGRKAVALKGPFPDDDVAAAWLYEVNGRPMVLTSMKTTDFSIMRGAGLLTIPAEQKP